VDADSRQLILSEELASAAEGAPNPQLWSAELGGGGWGCEQRQIYTADRSNVAITAAGHLAITARRQPDGTITSARLMTKDRFTVQYGLIEARIKVPGGLGTWPAFWMLGSDIDEVGWPACGEIDIMEHVGSAPNTVHGTVHAPGYSGLAGGIGGTHVAVSDLSEDFHIYAVDWDGEQITWLLDGQPYHRMTPAQTPESIWPFRHGFYLVVNLAVGGAWPGNDTETPALPATLLVDWIRVRT
jgi:beta-glucanase (GH16 family)